MLELFAPTRIPERSEYDLARPEPIALWRADALHRAKNLAQLTIALISVAEHRKNARSIRRRVTDARALARAYDELGHDDGLVPIIPCAALLNAIASRLVLLFGQARSISTIVTAQPVSLEPDRRRALILICSELVINALKYGFPVDAGGMISIRLETVNGDGILTVEDDGQGDVAHHIPGQGSQLLGTLAGVLGATIARASGTQRGGYRVMVTFPIASASAF